MTYPSGIRLLVHENPKATQVTFNVSYRVGTVDEPEGKEGLANLSWQLTHFTRPGGPETPILLQRAEELGLVFQNLLTPDESAFSFTGPPERFSRMVDLAAQRMKQPLANLSPADFFLIRDQVAKRLAERQKTDIEEFRLRWMPASLLLGHPYGHPRRGIPESIQRLTLEDVRDFLQAYNTPAHAVVVVTGPLSSVDVKSEMERGFVGLTGVGSTEKTPPVEYRPPDPPAPPARSAPMVVLPGPVEHPRLWLVWTLPGVSSGKEYQAEVTAGLMMGLLRELSMGVRVRRFSAVPFVEEWHGTILLVATVDLWKQEDAEVVLETVRKDLRHLKQWRFITRTHSLRIEAAYKQLRSSAERLPVHAVVNHLRATGRPDYLQSKEQRIAKELSDNSMDAYLSTYLRPEHLRAMLVVPERTPPPSRQAALPAEEELGFTPKDHDRAGGVAVMRTELEATRR